MSDYIQLFRSPTYGELKARHDEVVRGDQANRRSAINSWMEHHGYSDDTWIANEFGIEFPKRLASYLAPFAKQTQYKRKSILKKYREVYFQIIETSQLPSDFYGCLRILIVPFEKDLPALAQKADVSLRNLQAWLTGIIPGFKSEDALKRLERGLNIPTGTLINRLPHLRFGKRAQQTGKTVYGRRIITLQGLPFRLKFEDWPPQVQHQWNVLVRHKTATLLPKGERRNKRWNVDNRGRCSSAETRLGWIEDFFGFLVLSPQNPEEKLRGKGFSIETLDLALLSDTELLNDYLEFQRIRTGVYTEFARVFLAFVYSLCLPIYGWLGQRPEMASNALLAPKLPSETVVHRKTVPLTSLEDRWLEWLAQTCGWIKSNRSSLNDKIQKGRDNEPIEQFLAEKHPMAVLIAMADAMANYLPVLAHQPKALAIAYRDMLLVLCLTANPLRIKMYSIMSYRADNTGNLRQMKDGSWWLWFSPADFKNMAGAAKDEYLVPLPRSLWPYIETYFKTHRPRLAGAGTCDYVFRPDSRPGLDPDRRMGEKALSDIVLSASQYYVPNCAGFGPHAFRHLIATDLIKNDQLNGWSQAAAVLHDKLETVRDNYAHLKTSDSMAVWNTYYEEKLRQADARYVDPQIETTVQILKAAVGRGLVTIRNLIDELEADGRSASFFKK